MNPIASSLLMVAGSLCACGAAARPAGDPLSSTMLMVAVGLGLWGGLSLVATSSRWNPDLRDTDELDGSPSVPTLASRSFRSITQGVRAHHHADLEYADGPRTEDLRPRVSRSTRYSA